MFNKLCTVLQDSSHGIILGTKSEGQETVSGIPTADPSWRVSELHNPMSTDDDHALLLNRTRISRGPRQKALHHHHHGFSRHQMAPLLRTDQLRRQGLDGHKLRQRRGHDTNRWPISTHHNCSREPTKPANGWSVFLAGLNHGRLHPSDEHDLCWEPEQRPFRRRQRLLGWSRRRSECDPSCLLFQCLSRRWNYDHPRLWAPNLLDCALFWLLLFYMIWMMVNRHLKGLDRARRSGPL